MVRILTGNARTKCHPGVHSPRLDYCNRLLYGAADDNLRRLQEVQNAAARLITGTEGGTISRQSCRSFTGCRVGNTLSSSWQYWRLESWTAFRRRRMSDDWMPACPRHQPPTATVFQCPNMCATTYHYTSGRSGFCCCRTAPVEVSQQNWTISPLPRTFLSGAKDTFVLPIAAAPCEFLFYLAV